MFWEGGREQVSEGGRVWSACLREALRVSLLVFQTASHSSPPLAHTWWQWRGGGGGGWNQITPSAWAYSPHELSPGIETFMRIGMTWAPQGLTDCILHCFYGIWMDAVCGCMATVLVFIAIGSLSLYSDEAMERGCSLQWLTVILASHCQGSQKRKWWAQMMKYSEFIQQLRIGESVTKTQRNSLSSHDHF